jgi:hypothetical protein
MRFNASMHNRLELNPVERARSAISPFTTGDLRVHVPDLGVHHGDLDVHHPPISTFTIARCVHTRPGIPALIQAMRHLHRCEATNHCLHS